MANPVSTNVSPEEYNIVLQVNLFRWSFKGKETISIVVGENVRRISMNSVGLDIASAACGLQTSKITHDTRQEVVHFDFDECLKCGANKLVISFKGKLQTDLKGLYRSHVTDIHGVTRRIAVTQFQPTNARSCFPCWDSPDMKASFRLTIITSEEFQVLSNMPAVSRSHTSGGRVRVSFAPSPRMSTYVFGFVVGSFSAVEKVLPSQLRIRVNSTSAMPEAGLFAANLAAKALSFFQSYFAIPYPLPKLDLVALPELSPDGMEHWGLITFRESALLVDPDEASPQSRKSVALVICHEIAHQWFGNLVTMRSWTDLWLNEGFASFLMHKCSEACVPELVDSSDFVVKELNFALEVDALESTHPLQAPECRTTEDVLDSFDGVAYSKGAALIMMLHEFLGSEVFQRCLQVYLERFKFSCATNADLWATFAQVSGQPLEDMLRFWIDNAGYPVISVSRKNNELTLKQQQFLADGSPGPLDKIWNVPITLASSREPEKVAMCFLLKSKEAKVDLGDIFQDGIDLKVNVRSTGIYRVLYEGSLLNAVVECAQDFTVNDRIGVMDDLFALARAGHIPTRVALEHGLTLLHGASHANLWRCFDACVWPLGRLAALQSGGSEAFRAFLLHVFQPQLDRLGWNSSAPCDDFLRPLVLLRLGTSDHRGVVRAARRRFWRHVRGRQQLPSGLRHAVFATVLSQGGTKELEAVLELLRKASVEDEERIIQSLGFTATSQLDRVFHLAFDDCLRPQQKLEVIQSCALATPENRWVTWSFLRSNWTKLAPLCDGLFGVGGLITTICFDLIGNEDLRDMEDFFTTNDLGCPAAVRQCLANVRVSTAQLDRDGADMMPYFQQFFSRGQKRKRTES